MIRFKYGGMGPGRVSSAFAFEPIMPLFCQSEATETRLPEKPFRLAGKNRACELCVCVCVQFADRTHELLDKDNPFQTYPESPNAQTTLLTSELVSESNPPKPGRLDLEPRGENGGRACVAGGISVRPAGEAHASSGLSFRRQV